jgi:RNA polymerase sigma-70 factor (ECF subfamily)
MEPAERLELERARRAAVLAGDARAWQAWYDESYADLYSYALWRSGGLRDRADEVVQETWLTAVGRLGAFDPDAGSFAGWLRGIAANVLRNLLRRQRRGLPRPAGAGQAPPADAAAEQREQAERVARALAGLPAHYEEVLRGKYLEGWSVARIAAARGETVKAVESLLTRARQAFREAFAGEE